MRNSVTVLLQRLHLCVTVAARDLLSATLLPGSCPPPLLSSLPCIPLLVSGFGLDVSGSQLQGAPTWSTSLHSGRSGKLEWFSICL